MSKRLLSSLMILCLILSLAACGSSENGRNDETEPVVDPYAGTKYIGDLEDENLNGFRLNVLCTHTANNWFLPEDYEQGDVLDLAVAKRNSEVEARYNATIHYIPVEWKEVCEMARAEGLTGSGAYDVVSGYASDICAALSLNKLALDWDELTYVNPEKPYYVQNATEAFSIAGHKTLMVGEWSTSAINSCCAIVYNKSIAEAYQVQDLYELVDSHEWTVDTFRSIIRDLYSDTDGVDGRSENDFYGFTCDVMTGDPFYIAWEMNLVGKDENDYPYILPLSETTANNYHRLYELFYETNGTMAFKEHHIGLDKFLLGNSLFSLDAMNGIRSSFYRDLEWDYGLLPLPLYSTEQKDYISSCDGANAQVILHNTDPERLDAIGILFEALNAYSAEYVTPVLCETTLKIKGARSDEQSARMIDKIIAGRTFSFAQLDQYNFPVSPLMIIRNNITKKKETITTYYERNINAANRYIERLIEEYDQ